MNKNLIVAILIMISISLFALTYYKKPVKKIVEAPVVVEMKKDIINNVTFSCAEKKSIQALISKDKVELNLSDKRSMLLLQGISASGVRYTNTDESFVFWNKGNTAFITEGDKTTFRDCVEVAPNNIADGSGTTLIANPASVNCSKAGGSLRIEKNGVGGEYGLCYFADNRACEEWALYRKECPLGGVKTTGFDSIDQKYCAWYGGETLAVKNSVCTFKNKSKCPTLDFYNGKCNPTQ